MSLRWYGKGYDTIPLSYIRQIPGVKGVISTLFSKDASELWTSEEIRELKEEINKHNLDLYGIESLNVSESIKANTQDRDKDIETYIQSLENLGKEDIHLVCYNFMPLFDWTRTNLALLKEDGSTVLAFNQDEIDGIDFLHLFEKMSLEKNSTNLPGWENDKEAKLLDLALMYQSINEEDLFNNFKYFMDAILPTCIKYDIKMALHPDDPAWPILGIPRIAINKENILRMFNDSNDIHNGLTFCAASLGSASNNDLIDIIDTFKDRIHFAHLRNIKHTDAKSFEETSHYSEDGDIDMYQLVKNLYDCGFDGIIRPDHGRMIWDEKAIPGYGLYDRALGATYLNGLWEAISKEGKK